MNELDTRNLLTAMAADPAPPTTVDVDRAIATAKRKRQTTRWGVLATAAAAVLVVTIGLVTIVKPDEPKQPTLASAPAYFDPLHPRLEVGWWPEGFDGDNLWNAAITAEFISSGAKTGGKSATVYALPQKGGFPAVEFFGKPVETAELNGRPSTWHELAARDPGAQPVVVYDKNGKPSPSPKATPKQKSAEKNAGILRWYYADGGQAQVEVHGFQNAKEVAYQIATSVRLDRPRNFRMAAEFSRPNIPIVRTGGTSEGTIAEFASPGWRAPSLIIGVGPERYVQKANYKLNGKPVRRDLIDSSALFEVPFGAGQELSVQCSAKDNTQAAKIANNTECERVTASAKPVGTLADPSSWSDNPVR